MGLSWSSPGMRDQSSAIPNASLVPCGCTGIALLRNLLLLNTPESLGNFRQKPRTIRGNLIYRFILLFCREVIEISSSHGRQVLYHGDIPICGF